MSQQSEETTKLFAQIKKSFDRFLQKHRTPLKWISFGFVAGTFACAFIFKIPLLLLVTVPAAFLMLFSRHSKSDNIFNLFAEIALSVVIAYAVLYLITFSNQSSTGAGTPLPSPKIWFSENIAMATLIGFMLLCLTVTLRAAGLVFETKEITEKIEDQEKSLTDAMEAFTGKISDLSKVTTKIERHTDKLNHVDLVNRALELRSRLEDDASDQERIDALQAGHGTLVSWEASSTQKINNLSKDRDLQGAASAAWWKIIQSYSYEERLDLTQFEMATNVRNYSVLLISALETFRSKLERSRKYKDLVIVQCSTFSAKDFINFPFGVGERRRYWDAEFFGTYRRSMSAIFALPDVHPHRVVLCYDNNKSDAKNKGDEKRDFDEFFKKGIRVESKSHHLLMSTILTGCSYAIPISSNREDFYERGHLARVLGGKFDPLNTNWVNNRPNYCLLRPTAPLVKHEDFRGDFSKQIYKPCVEVDGSATELIMKDKKIFDGTCFLGFLSDREKHFWSLVDNLKDKTAKFADNKNLSSIVTEISNSHKTLSADRKKLLKIVNQSNNLGFVKLEERLGLLIGAIVMTTQKMDALYAEFCSSSGDHKFPIETTGTQQRVAPAEHWLYHFLNFLDASSHEGIFDERARKIPAWDLFVGDMLGHKRTKFKGKPETWPSRNLDILSQNIRFVDLNSEAQWPSGLTDKMTSGDLSSEFMMIGFRKPPSKNGDPEKEEGLCSVEWGLLVTSDVAEPYNSCRLGFHLNEPGSDFSEHKNFVENLWENEDVIGFSNKMCSEILQDLSDIEEKIRRPVTP